MKPAARLLDSLCSSGPVLLDGGWATQLQERGLPIGACPDEWNLIRPDLVEEAARAYLEAGSRIILTNTFGASRISLSRHGLAHKTAEINRAGVQISRSAANRKALVFASIGPIGPIRPFSPMGSSPQETRACYEEQARLLADNGAD